MTNRQKITKAIESTRGVNISQKAASALTTNIMKSLKIDDKSDEVQSHIVRPMKAGGGTLEHVVMTESKSDNGEMESISKRQNNR